MEAKETSLRFRVDTPKLLKEIADAGLVQNAGVLFIPLNVLRTFLTQVSERCSEINDPILNRLMFDMNLYELPSPSTKEYSEIMNTLYETEKEYNKSNK